MNIGRQVLPENDINLCLLKTPVFPHGQHKFLEWLGSELKG